MRWFSRDRAPPPATGPGARLVYTLEYDGEEAIDADIRTLEARLERLAGERPAPPAQR